MADKPITITTPLGDALAIQSMHGGEELGRLFEYDVELLGDENKVEAAKLLGQSVTIQLQLEQQKARYFNGFVCRFAHVGGVLNQALYRATLRPWFWFLTRVSDCRIFQNKTVPDVIKEIFRDNSFTDFQESLSRT